VKMRSELGRPNWTRDDLEAKVKEWIERWKGRVPVDQVEAIYDRLMDKKRDNFELTSIDFLNAASSVSKAKQGPPPCDYCVAYEQNKGQLRPCPVHFKRG
jgi:hypothetical protein